jgi:thiamine phosphate synthase YjbQ (UPF0047 family)
MRPKYPLTRSALINSNGMLSRVRRGIGKLDFGTWGKIFYGEFDGRRKKRVLVKMSGE